MTKLNGEASILQLLQEMTVREKIDLLTGASNFSSLEMKKYGIPSIRYLDGATGVNLLQYVCEFAGMLAGQRDTEKADSATLALDSTSSAESGGSVIELMRYITTNEPLPDCFSEELCRMIYAFRKMLADVRPNGEEPNCFPPGMLLGATWNPELVEQVGVAVGREASAYGVDVLLGTPNTNIQRDPRNGRLFESFSEDPYLSSRMAPAMVRGVQAQGVAADVKHFAANNQETLRQGIDEQISERALREIYLPGFEAAVKEGGVATVMSAYNSINGVPCAQNRWLLTDVLKHEWGFDGQVVSDWGAVYDQAEALRAGNDMDMPGPRGKQQLYEAVERGEISMERIDDAAARMLRTILKTPKYTGKRFAHIDDAFSQRTAYCAAAEGITLLKNDGVLPLAEQTRLALLGRLSERFMESGAGSAQVDTSKTTGLRQELARYTQTISMEVEKETQVAVITVGASGQEGRDRPDMRLDPEDEMMLRWTLRRAKEAGKRTVVLLNVAGPVELTEFMDDIDALVCIFFPGGQGAKAVADILFGICSPSGKLPLTFPKTYRDTPTAINFPGEYGHVNYGEGIFVGYRYYDYKRIEPLFPFGFGLSYSAFSITDVNVSTCVYDNCAKEPLQVSVVVKNIGSVAAKEVVQLYIHADAPSLLRPEHELKAFQKVLLEPGQEQTVSLELLPRAFAAYDTELSAWVAEPGVYMLLLGNSSRNLTEQIRITLTGKSPYGCSLRAPVSRIVLNARALSCCETILGSSFDTGKLRSHANYFGSTQLGDYLSASIPEEKLVLLEKLDEALSAL